MISSMTAADALVKDKINRCLRSDEARELVESLCDARRREIVQLIGSRELLDIGRCQGRLEILNWLLKLREEQ